MGEGKFEVNNIGYIVCFSLAQDDLRCVTRSLDQSRAEKADLTVKIDELHLYNDNSEAELKKIIKNKQVK